MPIVIVADSGGGFGTDLIGPRPGRCQIAHPRLGSSRFALWRDWQVRDWIAENRSTFFVSSYTPHTADRNVYLEDLLRQRSVPYSSELRHKHLWGMVTSCAPGIFRIVTLSPMHGPTIRSRISWCAWTAPI